VELHLAGHSAGSILLAPLVQLLTTQGQVIGGPAHGMQGMGAKITSLNLWAPAITMDMFMMTYVPAIESGAIERAGLFTLTDKAENDDSCARIYNKSLLYLVAHAFETQPRSWIDRRLSQGTPLAGMARFIAAKNVEDQAFGYERVHKLIKSGRLDWILSPTSDQLRGSAHAANATTHGGFDDDRATLEATAARILDRKQASERFGIHRSEAGLRDRCTELISALDA
jgi:hypothetical protein